MQCNIERTFYRWYNIYIYSLNFMWKKSYKIGLKEFMLYIGKKVVWRGHVNNIYIFHLRKQLFGLNGKPFIFIYYIIYITLYIEVIFLVHRNCVYIYIFMYKYIVKFQFNKPDKKTNLIILLLWSDLNQFINVICTQSIWRKECLHNISIYLSIYI